MEIIIYGNQGEGKSQVAKKISEWANEQKRLLTDGDSHSKTSLKRVRGNTHAVILWERQNNQNTYWKNLFRAVLNKK